MIGKSHGEIRQFRMAKPFKDYRAVIFDMDGTLYYQLPLRLRMAGKLAAYYLRHPFRYKELLAVKTFREIREHSGSTKHNNPINDGNSTKHNGLIDDGSSAKQNGTINDGNSTKQNGTISSRIASAQKYQANSSPESLDWQQYRRTAEKLCGVTPEWVKQTVEHWMYQVPLELLPLCQDQQLAKLIRMLQKRRTAVIIYSDYPAVEKARVLRLRIEPDHIFSALDADIMCLKPDPKGLAHILSVTGLSPDQALMVGDRYEKDGMAARNAGMDWLILPSNPKKRNKLLKEILKSCP